MQSPAVQNNNSQQQSAPSNNGAPNGSGGGGGGPSDFIGALISLISRADIRYQGFLASIDPVQATIALEKGEFKYVYAASLSIHLGRSEQRLIQIHPSTLSISSLLGYRRASSSFG